MLFVSADNDDDVGFENDPVDAGLLPELFFFAVCWKIPEAESFGNFSDEELSLVIDVATGYLANLAFFSSSIEMYDRLLPTALMLLVQILQVFQYIYLMLY